MFAAAPLTTNPESLSPETLRMSKGPPSSEAQPYTHRMGIACIKGRKSLTSLSHKPPDAGYLHVAELEVEFSGWGEVVWGLRSQGGAQA